MSETAATAPPSPKGANSDLSDRAAANINPTTPSSAATAATTAPTLRNMKPVVNAHTPKRLPKAPSGNNAAATTAPMRMVFDHHLSPIIAPPPTGCLRNLGAAASAALCHHRGTAACRNTCAISDGMPGPQRAGAC